MSDKTVSLVLQEAADGTEQETVLRRKLCYGCHDVLALCFKRGDAKSLESVKSKWATEVRNYTVGVPVVLLGLQKDEAQTGAPSEAAVKAVADEIGAKAYFEVSANTKEGVEEAIAGIAAAGYPASALTGSFVRVLHVLRAVHVDCVYMQTCIACAQLTPVRQRPRRATNHPTWRRPSRRRDPRGLRRRRRSRRPRPMQAAVVEACRPSSAWWWATARSARPACSFPTRYDTFTNNVLCCDACIPH